MTGDDLTALSAEAIATRVAAREISAREVTEAALARIDATEGVANAFILVDHEGARAGAERLDRAIAAGETAGPLAGVPVSVKDLVQVAGLPTSFGSAVLAAARLRGAGAIVIGKTTTPELGHKAITQAPLFGRTLNPWNLDYTSGGSSGGAAVSLALRQVPLAVGTDGGGSIRIPASACGTFGLKATLGRVPHVHAPDLFANNSYIGPMARTPGDLRLMYDVMQGADPRDPWSRAGTPGAPDTPAGRPRVGYALTVGNPAIEPEIVEAVEAAIAQLRRLGCACRPVTIDFCRFESHFRALLEAALAGRVGRRLEQERDRFDPTFVQTLKSGLRRSGAEVQEAAVARSELFRLTEALFREIDVLVTPTLAAASLPAATDPHGEIVIDGRSAGRIRAAWHPYTFPMNLTGHPALSMPCGWTGSGLPIGLQLVGRWYHEDTILDLAEALFGALQVERRRPPL